jgi:hypothetical protein
VLAGKQLVKSPSIPRLDRTPERKHSKAVGFETWVTGFYETHNIAKLWAESNVSQNEKWK